MATARNRFKIDRAFMRKLTIDGTDHTYQCDELRGFGVRVTPLGVISYTMRYTRPDGTQGRLNLGRYSEQNSPAEARQNALKELKLIDQRGDSVAMSLERKQLREQVRRQTGASQTLETFLTESYEAYLVSKCKPGGATKMLAHIRRSFPEFLETPLSDITPQMLEVWREKRLTGKVGHMAVTPATCNRKLEALKGVFSRALAWDIVAVHPMDPKRFALQKNKSGVVRFLDNAEDGRLFAALDAREEEIRCARDRANAHRRMRGYKQLPNFRTKPFADHLKVAVCVALDTGARKEELLTLEWTDIDFEHRLVKIRDENAKTSKVRYIAFTRRVFETLRAWKTQAHDIYVFGNPETGRPITDIKKAWGSVLALAKIPTTGPHKFRWHDLRHTFASRLVQRGADLERVRVLMGHASSQMTQRYAHLRPNDMHAAITLLDRPVNQRGSHRKIVLDYDAMPHPGRKRIVKMDPETIEAAQVERAA